MKPTEYFIEGRLAADERLVSVGRPTPAAEVRIRGPHGEDLGPGETGEIVVRGDFVMDGYFENPELTAAASTPDGFLRTGDVGVTDAEGFLTIVGRLKEMIITGGFNVYPAEVENALASLPDVSEAAVFGVPDPTWGEAVVAAVTLRAGCRADPEVLRRLAKQRLGGVKSPRRIHIVDEIPRNEIGKILKLSLIERFGTVAIG
jgi:acyl-CoA synthetase (AMP-forming)/AMP-acid ligase II